jgi:hypothetical protein
LERRLLDLELVQRERRQGAMLEQVERLLDDTPDWERAVATIFWYWVCHEPAGPGEDDLGAMLRLLRRQSLPRRYRVLVERAQDELRRAEAGEARPVFADLWQWLAVDREPGRGRAGTGVTW